MFLLECWYGMCWTGSEMFLAVCCYWRWIESEVFLLECWYRMFWSGSELFLVMHYCWVLRDLEMVWMYFGLVD